MLCGGREERTCQSIRSGEIVETASPSTCQMEGLNGDTVSSDKQAIMDKHQVLTDNTHIKRINSIVQP